MELKTLQKSIGGGTSFLVVKSKMLYPEYSGGAAVKTLPLVQKIDFIYL